jgi:hypothetical protein
MFKLKINITKRLLVQMAIISAIVGAAVLFDVYFENNPAELKNIQTESEKQGTETDGLYIIAQTGATSVKTSEQKSTVRKLQIQSHDKFLRKYHQIRNYQVRKAKAVAQTAPLIQSYHYLVFQNYFFTQPDDELSA